MAEVQMMPKEAVAEKAEPAKPRSRFDEIWGGGRPIWNWDPRQEAVRQLARLFCEREVVPVAKQLDQAVPQKFAFDLYDKVAKAGFIGFSMPAEYGGGGRNSLEYNTLVETLGVLTAMLPSVTVDASRTQAIDPYMLATDAADYLVRKGKPFREAHGVVRDLVDYARTAGKGLGDLTLEEYRKFSPLFEGDILGLDMRKSAESRDVPGGTAPRRVAEALKRARERLEEN